MKNFCNCRTQSGVYNKILLRSPKQYHIMKPHLRMRSNNTRKLTASFSLITVVEIFLGGPVFFLRAVLLRLRDADDVLPIL